MALIDRASAPTILTEDHLFSLPPTVTERLSTHDFEIGPAQAVLDSSEDILFVIPATYNDFISLNDMRFSCDLMVRKHDKTEMNALEDTITPVNNILHSLFKSVTLTSNGRLVSDSSELHYMRAYIETLLGYSTQTQRSQFSMAGWFLDEDSIVPQHGEVRGADIATRIVHVANKGAKVRRDWLLEGQPIQLSGKLHLDMLQQPKPLITGVEIQIRLVRSRIKMAFCADTVEHLPNIAIRNPRLRMRRFEPAPAFLNSVAKTLLSHNVKYHINRVAMRSMTFGVGMQFVTWSNVTMGQLPKMAILGIVSNSGFSGTHDKSPYSFAHFDLSHVAAEIEGVSYPGRGYDMDYDTAQAISPYEGLLDCLDRLSEGNGELPFDRFGYKRGYALYGFDFTVARTSMSHLALIKTGNLNFTFRFKTPLPEAVIVVCMLVFDNIIEITNTRQVVFDYAP